MENNVHAYLERVGERVRIDEVLCRGESHCPRNGEMERGVRQARRRCIEYPVSTIGKKLLGLVL